MAVNIRPLNEAAKMIGSTIEAILRMGILLFAFANSVRICNISAAVEITSAKVGRAVAHFATWTFTLSETFLPGLALP